MKYKATAGDWTMTYDGEAKLLTMRRAERGNDYRECFDENLYRYG